MNALGRIEGDAHPAPLRAEATRARRERQARDRRLKLAVLALAIVVPTVAARGELGFLGRSFGIAGEHGPVAQAFETPGESFPGSAMYWLEDAPTLSMAELPEFRAGEGEYQVERFAETHGSAGAAAEAFRAGGTGLDKARALQCLSMAVYYEAASESYEGQEAVAQVVLNRVAHPAYPNSVCGVVFQGSERKTGCQFTFTCDGALARRPSRFGWARAQEVALAALAGRVFTPVGLATHYHTNYVNPYWASSLTFITTIGAHRFYRWRGKAGTAGAFSDRYSGFEGLTVPAPGSISAASQSAATAPQLPPPPPNSALGSAPIAQPPAAGAPAPVSNDKLPQSGGVKDQYRNSGRWIAEPGKPKSD